MGKAVGGLPEATALATDAADEPSHDGSEPAEPSFALGAWLARQRELRGIRLEELSALTRLPLRSLERLEAGAFDGQQDGFVRGFVRTVAVAIGLDPDDAVARLLAEPAVRPRRRWPDPRRVAAAALGVGLAVGLAAAVWQWSKAPHPAARNEDGTILRRDPVRAFAIEQGLLPAGPAAAEAPEPLRFEPVPEAAGAVDPSSQQEAALDTAPVATP